MGRKGNSVIGSRPKKWIFRTKRLFRTKLGLYAQICKWVSRPKVILQQAVAKLPWGHNILLIQKIKDLDTRFWYAQQYIENGWGRDTLDWQIKNQLHLRQNKAISNFVTTFPQPQSDLAQHTLKDPYIFYFMTLDTQYREKDIENQLIKHVSKFLLELRKGFAFMGQQYHLSIADNDYYLDLLFYHTRLRCYVVIELKNTKFKPEYARR